MPKQLKLEAKPSLLLEILKRGPIVFPAQQITLRIQASYLILERSKNGEPTLSEAYPLTAGGVIAALESVNIPF